jgi:hypothetical protein
MHYITYGLQVSLKLDIAQDKIMLANTRLSVAAAVIGFAAYFTGTYELILMCINNQKLYMHFFVCVYILHKTVEKLVVLSLLL